MAKRPTAPAERSQGVKLLLIERELEAIHSEIAEVRKTLTTNFAPAFEMQFLKLKVAELEAQSVTQEQFKPVRLIVLGAVALVLTSFFGALITFVITKGAAN